MSGTSWWILPALAQVCQCVLGAGGWGGGAAMYMCVGYVCECVSVCVHASEHACV